MGLASPSLSGGIFWWAEHIFAGSDANIFDMIDRPNSTMKIMHAIRLKASDSDKSSLVDTSNFTHRVTVYCSAVVQ